MYHCAKVTAFGSVITTSQKQGSMKTPSTQSMAATVLLQPRSVSFPPSISHNNQPPATLQHQVSSLSTSTIQTAAIRSFRRPSRTYLLILHLSRYLPAIQIVLAL